MQTLKQNPNLVDFQRYIGEMVKERGFNNEVPEDIMLFMEEVGELARAVRKNIGLKIATDSKAAKEIEEELADCFMYILNLANRHDIDLEEAFRKKEEKNHQRVWK